MSSQFMKKNAIVLGLWTTLSVRIAWLARTPEWENRGHILVALLLVGFVSLPVLCHILGVAIRFIEIIIIDGRGAKPPPLPIFKEPRPVKQRLFSNFEVYYGKKFSKLRLLELCVSLLVGVSLITVAITQFIRAWIFIIRKILENI